MKQHYALTKEKYLTDPEYLRLHKRLDSLREVEPRNSALLFTSLYTGARAQEVLNIRGKDLDPEKQSVYIRGLKGSDDRDMPIPSWLFKQLTSLPATKRPSHPLFEITYPRFDQIWRSLRTTDKKLHALRHTFAMRLYKRTRDLFLVKTALGHRAIGSTLIYMSFSYSAEEMERILE